MALRPRLKPSSMISRYGSQALAGRSVLGAAIGGSAEIGLPESVVTSIGRF